MRVRVAAPAALLLAVAGLAGAGCRTKPSGCAHASTERCLWEAGVAPPTKTADEAKPIDGDDPYAEGGVASEPTQLDGTLAEMVTIIGAGLEWSLVDERARTLCSEEPRAPELDAGMPSPSPEAWTCAIPALDLGNRPLALEASEGVLSLSAYDIGDADSAELFELAQRRYDDWCAGERFKEFEGEGLAEFYRCSLPEGPYLVVARFPRDLKAGRWQVSIAIVDAG